MTDTTFSNQLKKRRRSLGRRLWLGLGRLPLWVRGPLIRRLFSIDYELPNNLIFKVGETEDEIEQALRIAYRGFFERGYIESNPSQIRLTKYHALPSTALLIAKLDTEVIATMTIVVDTAMGLPIEELWSLDDLRRNSARIVELSTLAVKHPYRSLRGRILLPLCKLMYHHCRNVLGADTLVAATIPEVRDFYRCVLLFDELAGGELKPYGFARGTIACGLYLRINGPAEARYKAVYEKYPPQHNLYRYFLQTNLPNLHHPLAIPGDASAFLFNPDFLYRLFSGETDVFANLTHQDRQVLANAYFLKDYLQIIGGHPHRRSNPRFLVNIPAHLQLSPITKGEPATLLEISKAGLRLFSPRVHCREKVRATLSIQIGGSPISINGILGPSDRSPHEFILLLEPPHSIAWLDYIHQLEQRLSQLCSINASRSVA